MFGEISNLQHIYVYPRPPLVSNMWCPCWASNNSTTGSTPLLKDKVCVLLISYVTCDINVVSLDMVCNKHLLYTICYSLISEGNRHFKHLISCGQGTHPSPAYAFPKFAGNSIWFVNMLLLFDIMRICT